MSTPLTPEPSAVILDRLSARFAEMSRQMSVASAEVAQLRNATGWQPVPAQPAASLPPMPTPPLQPRPPAARHLQNPHPQTPYPQSPYPQMPQPQHPFPQMPHPPLPPMPARPRKRPLSEWIADASDRGVVGAVLAVAGVGVTLIGIVFLLVLAAQAGILRPEFRVAGGAVLAAGLVGAALWWYRTPAGRIGAIALAATGIAAGYLDVLAATRIYQWLPPVAGLLVAAVVAGGGLFLARRWDSEHLGLLVIIPLAVLAPALTDGVDITLIGFMLVLSAATLWLQIGRDWIWLFMVRCAAPTLPLALAAVGPTLGDHHAWQFVLAAGLNGVLGVGSAVILLPRSQFQVETALISVVAVLPIALSGVVLDRLPAVLLTVAASGLLLVVVVTGKWFIGLTSAVRGVWLVASLALALIAVVTAFDASIAIPVVLGMALVAVAAAASGGDLSLVWRWCATILGAIGTVGMLSRVAPGDLTSARDVDATVGVTTLVGALLIVVVTVGLLRLWAAGAPPTRAGIDRRADSDQALVRMAWTLGGILIAYAITVFSVTGASMTFGGQSGFLTGHVVATICWMVLAAGAMIHARQMDPATRMPLLTGALCVVAASMAKLFLFDLAALDGIFRVIVFIVTGLILLAMGAWYARTLDVGSARSGLGTTATQQLLHTDL